MQFVVTPLTRIPRPVIVMVAALLMTAGCQSVPVSSVSRGVSCQPEEFRSRVHVIFVDSPVDVARVGDIPGVCDYVRCQGISNVHYYNAYHDGGSNWISEKVRCIRRCDPSARIMLVGWSSGTKIALQALSDLECQGVCVDTLVHLDSFILDWTNNNQRPRNVGRVVLIYRKNSEPSNIPYNAMYLVDECFHLKVPKSQRSVDALMTEIWRLTGNFPG